ncbi:uncharacterized protein [Acropora muricata]|uniref:uncharacterized protein n=1 Tax=Acropora muricata TaxID=159855 RepID=UPI0034E53029
MDFDSVLKEVLLAAALNHDLDLLREVVGGRPKNHTDWASIADKLNSAWGNEENPVRGRSCKEHFDVLLKHHKENNVAALKKSGSEEQYIEIQQLLDDVQSYLEALEQNQPKQKKNDQDRKKAQKMRDAAMETLKRKYPSSRSSVSDSEDEMAGHHSKDKPKAKRSQRPDVMSFLADKAETERDFKNQELQFRREALDTGMKLKRDALDVEMRRIELQEKQVNMQMELFKALINKH